MDIGKLFFSPSGRIGRQEFWLAWLALFAITTLTGWIPLIGLVTCVAGFVCHIFIYTKRLHDMGKSGWLQLWTYIPYGVALGVTLYAVIGMIISGVALSDMPSAAAAAGMIGSIIALIFSWLLAFLLDLGFLLWIGISEAEPFDNRFGPTRPTGDYKDAMPIV